MSLISSLFSGSYLTALSWALCWPDDLMSTTTRDTSDNATAARRIAILIPCHNEEPTVSEVVEAFHAELPTARIYVFDNNSTDRTVERALAAGAEVRHESRQGKGFVVQ